MTLRLALIQMNSKYGDIEFNAKRAGKYIEEVCDSSKPDLVLVPEFFNTGFFAQYRDYKNLDLAEEDSGHTITLMRKLAKKYRTFIVATLFEKEGPGLFYDTAIIIDDQGEIHGKYRKIHPAAVRSLEKIYFTGGTELPVFEIRGWKVGFVICYDALFPEVARGLAVKGAELLAMPYATHLANEDYWHFLHRTRALENGCFVATCNHVGPEGEWCFKGRSSIIDPFGEILVEASQDEEQTIVMELDKSKIDEAHKAWPMFRDRRPEVYRPIAQSYELARGINQEEHKNSW